MTRRVIVAGFVSWCAAGLLASPVQAESRPGTLVSITNDGVAAGTGTMIAIDRGTGAGSVIAVLDAPGISLAFSDAEGVLYGVFTIRDTVPARSLLATVDPATGAVTDVDFVVDATTGAEYIVAGMGFAADGTLYAVENATDSLVTIDPATAKATAVGTGLGVVLRNYGGTVADDVFYLLNGNATVGVGLYTVDLATGVATLVGPTGVFDNGIGLALDGDGEMVAVINDTFYEIDRYSGAVTPVGNAGFPALSSLEFVDTIHAACPCAAAWKNHGKYVSCVSKAAKAVSPGGRGEIVARAAQTSCGS